MKSLYSGLLLILFLTACSQGGDNATPTPRNNPPPLGEFAAEYFNNGVLVASERVKRASIHYANSDFNNIPAQNFSARWKTTLRITNANQPLSLRFDALSADVIVKVDGVEVDAWSNENREVPLNLSAGDHSVSIQMTNYTSSVQFNVSPIDYPLYTLSDMQTELSQVVDGQTEIIYLGATESSDLYNKSVVVLQSTAAKVLLVLSSYHPINWVLENPMNVKVAGIVFGSTIPGSTLDNNQNIATYEVVGLSYVYNDFTAVNNDISVMAGRQADFNFGQLGLAYQRVVTNDVAPPVFKAGPFLAEYYNVDTLVASETVDKPAVNYSYADFHAIDSYSFVATWKGKLEILDVPQLIDFSFDVSRSEVSFSIDGVKTAAWVDSQRVVTRYLQPGLHDIEIHYKNNWHTTTFNVNFSNHRIFEKNELAAKIAPLIDASTQVIYVGAYESANFYNKSMISLDNTATKVFLFVSSYSAIDWRIANPNGVNIAGIVYSGFAPGSSVDAPTSIPTFDLKNLAYGYSDFSAPSADIAAMIGRAPDLAQGEYALSILSVGQAPTAGIATIGSFTAEYYNLTNLVATETVPQPAINYSYAAFNGIDSNNFVAKWTGSINVVDAPVTLDISFDLSWSDVVLTIDNQQISAWSNTSKTISQQFLVGTHSIVIDYANHWHTTDFNVSISQVPVYTIAQASPYIKYLTLGDVQLIYVGAYEPASLYNTINVTLSYTASRVFLFFSSYSSANWKILNPNNVEIVGVAYDAFGPSASLEPIPGVPSFKLSDFRYAYDANFTEPVADIQAMSGRQPDITIGGYGLSDVNLQ